MADQTIIRGGISLIFFAGILMILKDASQIISDYLHVNLDSFYIMLWVAVFCGVVLILIGTRSREKFR
ncbi:MAG: hypothetical protein K5790_01185 [Nitrosopumilus sp.]|uniref:hypothetical protein n=1 Tax=Nitrosopumilus sp. TaxID=2024843 RepID=UPI00247C72BA|nr:hypothetical protein [Nitrosopumilus sp.]MCV0391887.1 hypothetical protein [Nitrosopumilus sp.]